MYALIDGMVELRKKTDDGEALLKTVERKNEIFGEMSLIDDQPRSASAVAVQPTVLVEIDEESFENLVKTNGEFAFRIIRILSERIRNSNRQIGDLAQGDQRERIQYAMADFGRREGEKIFNGGLKVNVEEMAAWINSHTGISTKDIENHIFRLMKAGTTPPAPTSRKTGECIVLSPEFMSTNDRRKSC